MSDEPTLMRQVVASPDDLASRRALAAVVGGPRGRFILGQLDAPALEIEALVRGNERAWGGPIVDVVPAARFIRGFVEWIVVDAAQFARDHAALLALAPIRHLDVARAGAAAAAFCACPGLAQIVGLSFDLFGGPHYAPAGDGLVDALVTSTHLGKLRYLDLRRNKLTEAAHARVCAWATTLPALEVLRLDDLDEQISEDWDGTITDVRPSDALAAFEATHGRCEALHYVERTQKPIARTAF